MGDVEAFLAAAIRLERRTALRYDELADAISGLGNEDVVAFFRQQALFSRRHLEEAKARAGFRRSLRHADPIASGGEPDDLDPDIPPEELSETLPLWPADGHLSIDMAMSLALEAEETGHAYYADLAANAPDPEVRQMAAEFEAEEAEHVAALKILISEQTGK